MLGEEEKSLCLVVSYWRCLLHQILSSLRTEPKSILSTLPDRHLIHNKCSVSPFGVATEIKTEERSQRGR